MPRTIKISCIVAVLVALTASNSFAQSSTETSTALLTDNNGDAMVSVLAFGDSVTEGRGDGIEPGVVVDSLVGSSFGPAYAGRLTNLLHVPVTKSGVAGEELLNAGAERLPGSAARAHADVVIFFEGFNDAVNKHSGSEFRAAIQRVVNVLKSEGSQPLLVTLPTPCCNHAGEVPFVTEFTRGIKSVAADNEVPLADVQKTWETSCTDAEMCQFFNLPEGLHPNTLGQDAIAQTIAASLLGIDVFAADGATKLSMALGVPASSIVVKPEAPLPVTPGTSATVPAAS